MSPEEQDLRIENEALRLALKDLHVQLLEARKRHSIILPPVQEPKYPYWSVPVLYPPSIASRLVANGKISPHSRSYYEMRFVREYSERGSFWLALPFQTSPEDVTP